MFKALSSIFFQIIELNFTLNLFWNSKMNIPKLLDRLKVKDRGSQNFAVNFREKHKISDVMSVVKGGPQKYVPDRFGRITQ